MKIKNGVILMDCWQAWHVKAAVDIAFFETVGHQAMMTSAADSEHSEHSKHYSWCAYDFRIYQDNDTKKPKYEKPTLQNLAANMSGRLGSLYDVVIEKSHIHVEYDPKY